MKSAAFAAVILFAALPAKADMAKAAPIVVELFQSQGCSSCPPAIANINAIADRPDVLALMFSVTYWDRLGWKDTFGKPEYTARQFAFGKSFGNGAYTPEVVIDGRANLVGTAQRELENAISKAVPLTGPALSREGDTLSVAAASAASADVWLVRYDPRTQNVAIGAGENSGVTIAHKNIVRDLVRLGAWSGAAQRYAIPAGGDPAWRTAVLVQGRNGGPILTALKL